MPTRNQPANTQSTESADVRPRVLILDPLHPDGVDLLRTVADVDAIGKPGLTEAELIQRIGDYQAVINRSRTSVTAAVIERGERLRIIVRAGVGLDNIDVDAAEARGIAVANCPDATTTAVAEHALALLLASARHVARADASLKAGRWEKSKLRGVGLHGKTLGIIGFGRIGKEVALRAQAFGMHVLVNQTRPTHELAQGWSVEAVGMTELLERADFVSLHVPMRPSNRGMIGGEELAMMKPTAILINTARGGLVDEGALLDALDNGLIAGAALDVFENEPAPNPALATHPRVTATPHIASSTGDAQRQVAIDAARKVMDALKRKRVAETLSLRLVEVGRVRPHEQHHPLRVERLARRIAEDGYLSNPPIVVEMGDEYVVLDGATRITAFEQLGIPHVVVQVVDVERDSGQGDNVQLHTWFHAVHGCPVDELMAVVRRVDGIHMVEMPAEALPHALWERSALGYLVDAEGRGYLLELAEGGLDDEADGDDHSWVAVLDELVSGYGAIADVDRTLATDADRLRTQFPHFAGLFVYPQFSPDIVLHLAATGQRLPAGLTRFVIPGRILRLNAPLSILRSDWSLEEKRDWLDGVVEEKMAERRLRYYEEPVVLLDE